MDRTHPQSGGSRKLPPASGDLREHPREGQVHLPRLVKTVWQYLRDGQLTHTSQAPSPRASRKRRLLLSRSPSTNTHTTCLIRLRKKAVVARRASWTARTSRSPRRSRLVILTSNPVRCVRCTGTRMPMNGMCSKISSPRGTSDTDTIGTGLSSSKVAHASPSSLPKVTRAHSTTWQAMLASCLATWATSSRTSATTSH
jgi:hypothetical protein